MDSSVPFLTSEDGAPKVYPLNTFYKTPHLEQLAKNGIRFSNFYAHSVCSPSRTSLLTGQNAAKTRITNWIKLEEKKFLVLMDLRIGIGKDSTKAVLRYPNFYNRKAMKLSMLEKHILDLEDQKAKIL